MLHYGVNFAKFPGRIVKIWHPWHPFFEENQIVFTEFKCLHKIMCENSDIYFLLCSVCLQFNIYQKCVCQPCKKFKFFISSNPCKNLTLLWYYTGFVIWHPYVPFFFHFVDTSKIATSTSFFNNKRGIFSSKRDRMGHKKFQRFQKWGQMLWRTITSHISKLPA